MTATLVLRSSAFLTKEAKRLDGRRGAVLEPPRDRRTRVVFIRLLDERSQRLDSQAFAWGLSSLSCQICPLAKGWAACASVVVLVASQFTPCFLRGTRVKPRSPTTALASGCARRKE